jgi:hypothetical protein
MNGNEVINEMEIRSFEVELRALTPDPSPDGEGKKPSIEGSAVVYGKKSELLFGMFREVIEAGFFEGVLKQDVRALWNHNEDLVLGRTKSGTLTLNDTERSLDVHIDPPDTQVGRDAVTSIKRGDVSQMSFGFTVKPGGDEWKKESDGTQTRTLKRGGCERLFDVSPVTYPAYPQTSVAVRSMMDHLKTEGLEPEVDANEEALAQVRSAARGRELDIFELSIKGAYHAPQQEMK